MAAAAALSVPREEADPDPDSDPDSDRDSNSDRDSDSDRDPEREPGAQPVASGRPRQPEGSRFRCSSSPSRACVAPDRANYGRHE